MRPVIESGTTNSSCRNLGMNDTLKKGFSQAFAIATVAFTIIPETVFGRCQVLGAISTSIITNLKSFPFSPDELSSVLGRVLCLTIILCSSILISCLKTRFMRSVTFKGKDYNIQVKYGDLLKQEGLKVIAFDECFTTKVGSAPGDINPTSICGQYLESNPISDMQNLIEAAELKPERKKSEYKNQTRYKSGSLVPHDDYLLMAFAKLDENGLGFFASRSDYLDSLNVLWADLNKRYNQHDVFISVLGAGVTRIGDPSPSMQELVDMIIYSYKLSPYKIKSKLCIVCKRETGFSLSKIGKELCE